MGSGSTNNTTLEDLAKLAGVSASTVSRALNDHPSISTRTKQRIWAMARELDYPFRRYMPSGPIGSEGAIAIVTPRTHGRPLPLSHPFFLELLASIGEAARDRGCDFTVSHTAPANYDDLLLATTTSRANGVIFLGQSTLHEAFNQLAGTDARFVVWGASVMLWLLSASINVAMEPFRAFVADSLPHEQRTTGFAMQVFFIGAGAVFASALPWVLTHWFGVSGVAEPGKLPPSVHVAFYVGGIGLLIAVLWTVFTTREHPPETLDADTPAHTAPTPEGAAVLLKSGWLWTIGGLIVGALAVLGHWGREIYLLAAVSMGFGIAQLVAIWLRRRGHVSLGVLEVVEDILHMPRVLRQLAIVQFFTWFGLFAMWIYTTPAVTTRHYHTTDAASVAYNQGADWVGVLFAGYNGVAALVALILPALAARIGRPASHAFCLGLGALGFLGFVLIDDPTLLWIPIVGIGCAWASIMSAPYAMLSCAAPPRKMGVYMGIHNLFLVIPQLVAATVLGPVVGRLFKGEAILALALAAGAFALAAISALTIQDAGEGDQSR